MIVHRENAIAKLTQASGLQWTRQSNWATVLEHAALKRRRWKFGEVLVYRIYPREQHNAANQVCDCTVAADRSNDLPTMEQAGGL